MPSVIPASAGEAGFTNWNDVLQMTDAAMTSDHSAFGADLALGRVVLRRKKMGVGGRLDALMPQIAIAPAFLAA